MSEQHQSGNSEEQFERSLKVLSARQLRSTGHVVKLAQNLYRVTSANDPIRQFDLQGSQLWAGSGNKQSSSQASGFVTPGNATTLSNTSADTNVTVYYEEAGNGVDLRNIHI